MAEYIEREAFIADKRWLYCTDCDKRKGKKRGKYVTLYEIGEAPCKSCWANDMLDEIEVYPAADVRPVVKAYWKSVPHKRARVCSRCEADEPYKFADDDANVYNFCPNCGADMRGEN